MKALQLTVEGNWGHFKRPETNNNPLTHDFITKTAFVGLMGAILGKERDEMRVLFPILCDGLRYGVRLLAPVRKESWAFTLRKATSIMEKAPGHFEFLKAPKYLISVALADEVVEEVFRELCYNVRNSKSLFTPLLGLHNCPANLAFVSEGEFSDARQGAFTAKCFVSNQHELQYEEGRLIRVGLDRIPTYQNSSFWNPPDRYREVIYPADGSGIAVSGPFVEYSDGERWWLI